jgi:sugar lactone lactonase YvrE
MKRRKLALRVVAILFALLALALGIVKLRYGRGAAYPDVGTAPLVGDVESLGDLDFPPGNVTGTKDGRVFFNTHPFAQSHRFTDAFLFELVDGKPRPYPDLAAQADLRFVFGMTVDAQNRLWLTSPATLDRKTTRLLAFDLATNAKIVDHELPPGVARFGQDLRITPDGKTLLLADTGAFRFTHASLVVVDLATWSTRELLADTPKTQPQDVVIQARGAPYRIGYGLLTFQVGLDGIATSDDGQWLFLAPMSHDTLYRVRLGDALDPSLSSATLADRLERVGTKPLSDGITATPDGRVLVTDVEHGGIVSIAPSGELRTLVKLDRVGWADGVFVGPKGQVYFTDSAIPVYIDPLLRPPTLERLTAGRPYHLYRFQLPP